MAETVWHGVTGFRCRTMRCFVAAVLAGTAGRPVGCAATRARVQTRRRRQRAGSTERASSGTRDATLIAAWRRGGTPTTLSICCSCRPAPAGTRSSTRIATRSLWSSTTFSSEFLCLQFSHDTHTHTHTHTLHTNRQHRRCRRATRAHCRRAASGDAWRAGARRRHTPVDDVLLRPPLVALQAALRCGARRRVHTQRTSA